MSVIVPSEPEIISLREAALSAIGSAQNLEELSRVRTEYVLEKSPLARANQNLGKIPAGERASLGKLIGEARNLVTRAFDQRSVELETEAESAQLLSEIVDVTLPAYIGHRGGFHPITIIKNEISDYFLSLGYSIAEGPEAESEWLNFDALNIPTDHPARSMQDTFFLDPVEKGFVLRTHTSPVQIRTMLENKPPIYIISPGKTFRADELDATHSPVFHQVEGLVVDSGIHMGHLKGTLDQFAIQMFGPETKTRLRPSFFPFTEPSAEVDIWFNDRWIEWGGCGMVNPQVLQNCGIDTDIYSGFAFGMGLERTLMVRQGIKDMHDIVEGDIRLGRSFGLGLS
jgi:phenylalanyl-tRNA synthetase alpha chain